MNKFEHFDAARFSPSINRSFSRLHTHRPPVSAVRWSRERRSRRREGSWPLTRRRRRESEPGCSRWWQCDGRRCGDLDRLLHAAARLDRYWRLRCAAVVLDGKSNRVVADANSQPAAS